jgi:hypothetical protein
MDVHAPLDDRAGRAGVHRVEERVNDFPGDSITSACSISVDGTAARHRPNRSQILPLVAPAAGPALARRRAMRRQRR